MMPVWDWRKSILPKAIKMPRAQVSAAERRRDRFHQYAAAGPRECGFGDTAQAQQIFLTVLSRRRKRSPVNGKSALVLRDATRFQTRTASRRWRWRVIKMPWWLLA